MTRRVLSVGQCWPDQAAIDRFLRTHFDVQVDQAEGPRDTLATLRTANYDLVLVNRKLDADYSDGIEVIKQIKAELAETPVMLVTNYPEHQDAAVAVGAARGFGKLQFDQPETKAALAPFLG